MKIIRMNHIKRIDVSNHSDYFLFLVTMMRGGVMADLQKRHVVLPIVLAFV